MLLEYLTGTEMAILIQQVTATYYQIVHHLEFKKMLKILSLARLFLKKGQGIVIIAASALSSSALSAYKTFT